MEMKLLEELTDIERRRLRKFADELFAEIETDEFLRGLGCDPEEIGRKMAAVAKDAMTGVAEKDRSLNEQCALIHDVINSAWDNLRQITGHSLEPQTDQEQPEGTLSVLEMRLRDLEYTARRVLTLTQEVHKRV